MLTPGPPPGTPGPAPGLNFHDKAAPRSNSKAVSRHPENPSKLPSGTQVQTVCDSFFTKVEVTRQQELRLPSQQGGVAAGGSSDGSSGGSNDGNSGGGDGGGGNDSAAASAAAAPTPAATAAAAAATTAALGQRSDLEKWLLSLDDSGDMLLQYWDVLEKEFGGDLQLIKLCGQGQGQGVLGKVDPSFWETAKVTKMKDKMLFARGISLL